MSWWRKRRKVHAGNEGELCRECGESHKASAARLEESVEKVLAGADDPWLGFSLPCGCEKDFYEPVRRCKDHASIFN